MLLRIFSEFETLNAVSGTCTCVSLHQTFTLIVFPKPFYIVSLSGKSIQGSCGQELQALSCMTGVIRIMVGDQVGQIMEKEDLKKLISLAFSAAWSLRI